MEVYLSARNIYKAYGQHIALADASLELYQGEILALLGPNGAGKTTLIKILATLLTMDRGSVQILGYDLATREPDVRHLFGYVGQDTDRSAYARLTVRENLQFFGAIRGLSRHQIDDQIDKLANYFDFRASISKQFMTLSGGQKQTVVIMRALLYDPPVVYLDEPTKGLDPFVAKRIRTFLKRYAREERKSLLLTSHILSEVDELANRVALINKGTVTTFGTPMDLKRSIGAQERIELPRDVVTPEVEAQITSCEAILGSTSYDDEWISFGCNDILEGSEAVIGVLRANHVKTTFRHRTVSLEDAFVYHIGGLTDRFEN